MLRRSFLASMGLAPVAVLANPDAGLVLPARGLCAHRGAMSTHPENTLPGLLEAVRLKAQMIEFDLQLSRDGRLVLMHDSTVDRTTNGSGKVGDLTFAELRQLDAGGWMDPRFVGTRIPTFEEVLEVMPGDIWLNCHLKGDEAVGKAAARVIADHGRLHQAFLAAGRAAAEAAKKAVPGILICNMERQSDSMAYAADTVGRGCAFIQLRGKGEIHQETIDYLLKHQVRINYYHDESPEGLRRLWRAGVHFPLVNDLSAAIRVAQEEGILPGTVESAAATGPQEGREWELSLLNLNMKWIPAGRFLLGSTPEERQWAADPEGGKAQADWFVDERDAVEVSLPQGFWMGQVPVTRGMFRQFVEAEHYQTEAEKLPSNRVFNIRTGRWEDATDVSWRNPGYQQSDDHPVVFVTWNDAMVFCAWLNRMEAESGRLPAGYEYRLPGEVEWEYAARGGSPERTAFWWGDDFSGGRGRVNGAGADRLADGSVWRDAYDWEDGFVYASPVDAYGEAGRNGFGLADMAGNIWEWCYDGYDPTGPQTRISEGDQALRMLRGASYMRPAGSLRIANRGRGQKDAPRPHRGFRLVLGPEVK